MRDKRRYILVESTLELSQNERNGFEAELYRELLHNIGEISYHRANPRIVKYLTSRRFVLKCSLAKYNEVIVALAFIKRINNREMGLYTLNASGTIRALGRPKQRHMPEL